MQRHRVAELVIVIGVVVLSVAIVLAVNLSDIVRDEPVEGQSAGQLSVTPSIMTTTPSTAVVIPPTLVLSTPTSVQPEKTSTPNIDLSQLNGRALNALRQDFKVVNGKPEVIFSRTMTSDELLEVNLSAGTYETGCDIRFHVVIINGDFAQGIDATTSEPIFPARYAAYIYVVALTAPDYPLTVQYASPDGSQFKAILEDPTLPDPPSSYQPFTSSPLPCVPIEEPGVTEEELDEYLGRPAPLPPGSEDPDMSSTTVP